MKFVYLIPTILFALASADIVSIGAGALAVGSLLGSYYNLPKWTWCKVYECCDAPHVEFNPKRLKHDLESKVFGQHLVEDAVLNAMKGHFQIGPPKSALALSFHGYTGTGKNLVADIIANNTFKLGTKSAYFTRFVSTADFPDKSRIQEYIIRVQEKIQEKARQCKYAMFVFDEIDKMPSKFLDAVKPFLEGYDSINGIDFRNTVFIFLSNSGGKAIIDVTQQHNSQGKAREALTAKDFERILIEHAFRGDDSGEAGSGGGLQSSNLITNQMLGHYIAFLPLEMKHAHRCVQAELIRLGRADLTNDEEFIQRVLKQLQWFPEHKLTYSSSGCKRVAVKTSTELGRLRKEIPGFSWVDGEEEL
ncbi:hypothetical protein WR25_07480 [Diploscapter pachys]|uniref:Torsin-1A C-terminal domain-containing protein n=1 Tax=Diploscapter pachys TaxID=2018661 RepID=A0A2A2LSA0_9BILA|nr:hypothetical protein WR25_07480 [Diploscapter pachys]